MRMIHNLIGGASVPPVSAQHFERVNPATGQSSILVPDSDDRDVAQAVAAARTAFPAWSGMPAEERCRRLQTLADRIQAELEPLALMETQDTGKPLSRSRTAEIPRAVANFRFFAT